MGLNFPDASSLDPAAQRWVRYVQDEMTKLVDENERLKKNVRSYQRGNSAGNKALAARTTSLANILDTGMQAGDPPQVTVEASAYFTASGYPAARAYVTWEPIGDALGTPARYEVWIRKVRDGVTDPDADGVALDFPEEDSNRVTATTNLYADIRGLEVLTQYALKVGVLSPLGTPGDFSEEIIFTTPNELTKIPSLGDPILYDHGGFVSVEWRYSPDYSPAYSVTEDTPDLGGVSVSGSPGSDPVPANLGSGVLAPNGKIYYPPGVSGFVYDSRGLVLDPENNTAVANDYGLTGSDVTLQGGQVFDGVLGDDGIIYWSSFWMSRWVSHGDADDWGTVLALDPSTEIMTVLPVQVDAMWGSLAKAGNGHIYGMPTDTSAHGFLDIDPTGTPVVDYLGYTPVGGESFQTPRGGVTAQNGDVWFMPSGTTAYFIVIDSDTGTASPVALTHTGWGTGGTNILYSPVLAEDGSIYAFSNTTTQKSWYRIEPDGTQTRGTQSGSAPMGNAVMGPDGRIRGLGGLNTNQGFYWIFDTETQTFTTQSFGFGLWSVLSLVASADGVLYFRCAKSPSDPSLSSHAFIVVTVETTDYPATGTLDIPNYLKYVEVQRAGGSGWEKIGQLAAPGFWTDPFGTSGSSYRLVPVSTAIVDGIPSNIVSV